MVNLAVETVHRHALITAGGFPASLKLSLHATNPRVQQGIQHIITQMAQPDTVIAVIDCGGMADLQRLAETESQGNDPVLRTAALFAWRASDSADGRASLLEKGAHGLLSQLTASSNLVSQYLGHLVAVSLLMETGFGPEWEPHMTELRTFVNDTDEDAAQAQIPGAVPLPVDMERIAAMAASSEPHAQVLGAWTFSILALDEAVWALTIQRPTLTLNLNLTPIRRPGSQGSDNLVPIPP